MHLATLSLGSGPQQALEPAVQQLLAAAQQDGPPDLPNGDAAGQHDQDDVPGVLLSAYWLQAGECSPSEQLPANVALCQLPQSMMGNVAAVQQAQQLYSLLFAGQALSGGSAAKEDDASDEEAADALDAALSALQAGF